MKFRYSAETGAVLLSCTALASFARSKGSAPLFSPAKESMPSDSEINVRLAAAFEEEGCTVCVCDTAELVYSDGVMNYLELRREKRKRQNASSLARSYEAFAAVMGYLLLHERGGGAVRIILTFYDSDGDESRFSWTAEKSVLSDIFNSLLRRALPFCKICAGRAKALPALTALPFPFHSIREGQREFINRAYRAIKSGSRLLVSAPTGIGKTMSALYPAVRALGSGECDRIFCLCAKNVTGRAAADGAAALSALAPSLRSVTVISKEKMCAFREESFSSLRCMRSCTLMKKIGAASYESRRDAALLNLLNSSSVYTPEMIMKCAEEYYLCPYELSLDLSEYCDIIVCDYNYAFDFSIRFRRYFDEIREKHVFLIDEAHNLPKRARDTYSASLDLALTDRIASVIDEEFPADEALTGALGALTEAIGEIAGYVKAESETDGENEYGFYKNSEIPPQLVSAAAVMSRTFSLKLREKSTVSRKAEKLDSELRRFVYVCGLFDSHYTFFAEGNAKELTVRLICLDPSVLLDRAMSAARSSILFSATLSPIDYFADICGCADADVLELPSPYRQDNLFIAAVDSVPTTLNERTASAPEVAELILSAVEGKCGNYLVYFPSYAYLDRVFRLFTRMADGIRGIRQTPGMSRSERGAFLDAFEQSGGMTTVGFCVLGGMFSEGIDLAGERLIGAIIVGTGMGSITSEQNILREYYDATRENGMDYAYVYPGFNNVLQAAGRVIRSENDRGIVILIDERYADPKLQRLFPIHWSHIKFTSDPFALQEMIDRFWEGE